MLPSKGTLQSWIKWRQQILSKRRQPSTTIHGVTSEVILIITASSTLTSHNSKRELTQGSILTAQNEKTSNEKVTNCTRNRSDSWLSEQRCINCWGSISVGWYSLYWWDQVPTRPVLMALKGRLPYISEGAMSATSTSYSTVLGSEPIFVKVRITLLISLLQIGNYTYHLL
jgi:hypothetical protein